MSKADEKIMSAEDYAEVQKWGDVWGQGYDSGDQGLMDYAHQQAENVRAKYNYTGGEDGAQIKGLSNGTGVQQSNTTQTFGNFSYGGAPTYTDSYSQRIDSLLNQVLNREEFSYDPEQDESYLALKEQYNREGSRAMNDTLASAAMSAGGMNSAAVTAAQQANDYYNTQLMDKIPELRQLAYQMYLDDISMQRQDYDMLQSASNNAYNRYRDAVSDWRSDRDFAYGAYRDDVADTQWQTQFDYNKGRDEIADSQWQQTFDRNVFESDRDYNYQVGRDQVADSQWQQTFDYNKGRDQVADSQWQSQFDYQKERDKVADSQWQQSFNLSAGKSGGSGSSGKGSSSGGKSGSSGSGPSNNLKGSDTTQDDTPRTLTVQERAMGLGIGPLSEDYARKLLTSGGIYIKADGMYGWSSGWNANNYRSKLNNPLAASVSAVTSALWK